MIRYGQKRTGIRRPMYNVDRHHEYVYSFKLYLQTVQPFGAQILESLHPRPDGDIGEHAPSLRKTFSGPVDHYTATLLVDDDPEEDVDSEIDALAEKLDIAFLDDTILGPSLEQISPVKGAEAKETDSSAGGERQPPPTPPPRAGTDVRSDLPYNLVLAFGMCLCIRI